MSLFDHFEQHEEQAFVAKALATAVAIIFVKHFFSGLISFLFLIFPVVFLIGLRMHAAASGVDAMDLLREHITFFPVMRSEAERRTELKPWVTYWIIFANVVIYYGFEMNVPRQLITDNLIFLPRNPDLFNVPLSAVTSIFLHASSGHLWGNMTFLWVVGSAVERRIGRQRFFWLYLATGLIGGLVFIGVEFLFHGQAGHALGASGAIAGIMGIFAIRCYFKSMIFPLPILGIFSLIIPISLKIRLNSLVIMALFFLADLSGGIDQITGDSKSMVGHWVHLGGMISGMLIARHLKLGEDAVEERHLEIGIKASQANIGFQDGERSMQIALDRSPDNVDALLGMARLKTKFENTPEGQEFYEKTLGLMVRARSAEVVEVFREYFAKYLTVPKEPMLVSLLSETLRRAGETELQVHCLEHLVEMPALATLQREKALYQLATLLEFTSCFEAARSCFARFAYEYPASSLAEKAREKAGDEVHKPQQAAVGDKTSPQQCPTCGDMMTARPVASGPRSGQLFWVCAGYPDCRTFLPVAEPGKAPEAAQATPALPQTYRLIFDGTIGFTSDPEQSKESLVQLFRCGRDQVERLCCGNPTVLKRGLDYATALKMKNAVSRTGALCTMEAEVATRPASVPASAPPPMKEAATETASPAPPTVPFNCPKCGHPQEKGECCVMCGVYFAKVARVAEREFHTFRDHLPGGASNPVMSEQRERRWAMWCHLIALSGFLIPLGNVMGPVVIWYWKRKESAFVDFHGKAAINYQLTLMLCLFGAGLIAALTRFRVVFVGPMLGLLFLYSLVTIIIAARKSRQGDYVEIALSAEFIKYGSIG